MGKAPVTIASLWQKIDAWLDENHATANIEARRRGATAAQLAALEKKLGRKLPADLRESLAIHNGGGYFDSYELLDTRGIASRWEMWTKRLRTGELAKRPRNGQGALRIWWDEGWIPFAEDSCGNLRCVDPTRRRLIDLEPQDSQGAYAKPRRTFFDWLNELHIQLSARQLVADEAGFVVKSFRRA